MEPSVDVCADSKNSTQLSIWCYFQMVPRIEDRLLFYGVIFILSIVAPHI